MAHSLLEGEKTSLPQHYPNHVGHDELNREPHTAYNCTNRSKVVESYSLLEPEACAASDGNGEIETTAFGTKALEVWKCCQARVHGMVALGRWTIHAAV